MPRANNVDKFIAGRIRIARNAAGMGQEKLGGLLGVTFQQIQKYEKGTNRISAGRLYHLAVVLGVPITFFFEDAPRPMKSKP